MDTLRAFEASIYAGFYFALRGGLCCALCLSIQSLLAAWYLWLSDAGGVATAVIGEFGYIGGLQVLSFSALIIGAILGFLGSILWFFMAGFYQQTQVGFDRRTNFGRTLKAALLAMTICGWCAALTGTLAFLFIHRIWPNLAHPGLYLMFFKRCLGIGNLLGCMIGVFAPNLVGRIISRVPHRFIRLS